MDTENGKGGAHEINPLSPEELAYWRHIDELFARALELPSENRKAFLDEACANDPKGRERLDALLAHAEAEDPLLEKPPTWPPALLEGLPVLENGPVSQALRSRFQPLGQPSRGAMGLVYKARDLKLDRLVALKFLSPYLAVDEEAKRRFLIEAKAASALDHANICTVHEINETEDGQLFIVMAFCEGETLKERIGRGPLSVEEAVNVALQAAKGLQAAHRKGVIHRDIKPANVMVSDEGVVKVVDFGIAKILGTELTRTGLSLGTLAYMSPEQLQGEEVDHRTDIWSLGVLLYEMLAGRRPFQGAYEDAVRYEILHKEPESIRQVRPAVPAWLVHVVEKALQKDQAARYQDLEAMLKDLNRIGEPLPEQPVAFPAVRAGKRRSSRPLILLGGAGLVMLMALVFLLAQEKPGRGTSQTEKSTSQETAAAGRQTAVGSNGVDGSTGPANDTSGTGAGTAPGQSFPQAPPADTITEPKATGVNLDLWTDKGRENLVYREGETVTVSLSVDRPAYVRLIYQLADSTRMFLGDVYLPQAGVHVDTFECGPPFGTEVFTAIARESKFPPLETVERDGDQVIREGAETRTRGIRRKKGLETERQLILTTLPQD